MGTVYLAERADQAFDKHVAIKIVAGHVAPPDLIRRFLEERRILATLDHPNIARVLDAGATADGLPFVVMEYVDGTAIDVHCRRTTVDDPPAAASCSGRCATPFITRISG